MLCRGAKWARSLLCSSSRSYPSPPLEASGGSGSVVVYCRFWRGHILRAFFEQFAGLDIQTMTEAGSSHRKQAVFVVVFGLEKTQNGKLKAYLQGEAGPMNPKAGTDRLGSLCHGSADAATTANDSERGGWLQVRTLQFAQEMVGGCDILAGWHCGRLPERQ
jgi:hypothetical protein